MQTSQSPSSRSWTLASRAASYLTRSSKSWRPSPLRPSTTTFPKHPQVASSLGVVSRRTLQQGPASCLSTGLSGSGAKSLAETTLKFGFVMDKYVLPRFSARRHSARIIQLRSHHPTPLGGINPSEAINRSVANNRSSSKTLARHQELSSTTCVSLPPPGPRVPTPSRTATLSNSASTTNNAPNKSTRLSS